MNMMAKPRRKNTKSPYGGETLGVVEDGAWEERPQPFLSSEARNYSEIYKLIDQKSPFLVVIRSYRTVDHILSCQLVEIRILRENLGLETIWPDFFCEL